MDKTLDQALEAFEECPCRATAQLLHIVALEYYNDGMIGQDELLDIETKCYQWI